MDSVPCVSDLGVVEMDIKPMVEKESSNASDFEFASSSARMKTENDSNTLIKSESETVDELGFESDLDLVKEKLECDGKEAKKEENSLNTNSNQCANDGGGNVDPMVAANINCGKSKSIGKGKRRDGARKVNKQRIPRNQAAKKKVIHNCQLCQYKTTRKYDLQDTYELILGRSHSNVPFVFEHLHGNKVSRSIIKFTEK